MPITWCLLSEQELWGDDNADMAVIILPHEQYHQLYIAYDPDTNYFVERTGVRQPVALRYSSDVLIPTQSNVQWIIKYLR